jgi:hypothetical protein
MTEIAVNDAACTRAQAGRTAAPRSALERRRSACGVRRSAVEELKNQARARAKEKSFFAFALNIGFFLCYFRRRVEFVGNRVSRSQTQ